MHLFEGLAVQGVCHDMADSDAAAAKALDVARDLITLMQVHEDNLRPARQLVVAAVQVGEQFQHEGGVLPPADQHRLCAQHTAVPQPGRQHSGTIQVTFCSRNDSHYCLSCRKAIFLGAHVKVFRWEKLEQNMQVFWAAINA